MDRQASTFNGAFDPETVAKINRAYAGAIAALGAEDAHSDARAALAKHMMDLAKAGETDEHRLRETALAELRQNSGS
jgi:hypothetical protein